MGFIQCTVRCIEIYCKKVTFFNFTLRHFVILKTTSTIYVKNLTIWKSKQNVVSPKPTGLEITHLSPLQGLKPSSPILINHTTAYIPAGCMLPYPVCLCVCAQYLVFYLNKGTVDKNHLRRHEEPPCQLSCPEPAIPSLLSRSPPRLPSSSAPLIGPLSGWWEDMLSSDGSAAQLTMLCVRARLRQGRVKNIPFRQGGCVCVCVSVFVCVCVWVCTDRY